MKIEEIIEGNKLIAEFMGLKKAPDGNYVSPVLIEPHALGDIFQIHQMKYHSSWQWLMPVVEKIESLHNDIYITHLYFADKNSLCESCVITDWKGEQIANQRGSSKIETVWNTCIEFIKWYNKNK